MKKLLFIGHTYHQKTKSSAFLMDLLRKDYEVTEYYMDPAAAFSYDDMLQFKGHTFDVLLVWQVMPEVGEISKHVTWKHAAFFPMYDHYAAHNKFYADRWSEYRDFIIISFSKSLYKDLLSAGFDTRYIKYFPKPCTIGNWGEETSLFFWQRLSFLDFSTLSKAAKHLPVRNIHLHKALDPGHEPLPLSKYDDETMDFLKNITFSESTWFDNKDELMQKIESSSLYMAPRHLEGIGMSFLEAMAHGRCVIAPDNPTMNEYIEDGINGLLYPWEQHTPTHCGAPAERPKATIRQIQQNAYQTVVEGYEKWCKDKYQILDWLQQDVMTDRKRLEKVAVMYGWKDWPIEEQPWPDVAALEQNTMVKMPANGNQETKDIDVSVVTVVFNVVEDGRGSMLQQCMESVQKQAGVSVEHIIVDGASTDATLQCVSDFANANHVVRVFSQKDNGIYDAMNRGIALARGKYIVFLNSDDFYHEGDGLKVSVEQLQQTNCSFSFAPVRIIDKIERYNPHRDPVECLQQVFLHAVFSHQSVLVDRQLMLQMHGFDLSYRSAADYDFILRMILSGKQGCYVNHTFVTYRMTGVSSTNWDLSQNETALVLKRLYNKYLGAHLTEAEAYRLHCFKEFPSSDMRLGLRMEKVLQHAFVGIPKQEVESYSMEWKYIKENLFNLKDLFYFFIVHFSSRFNRTWYLKTYRDVAQAKVPPAYHYLVNGWREGRDPSVCFSTARYLRNNPDVAKMNVCPLVHWIMKGKREKRAL